MTGDRPTSAERAAAAVKHSDTSGHYTPEHGAFCARLEELEHSPGTILNSQHRMCAKRWLKENRR